MTTAIVGTGGIGSVIARLLASGGEALRVSSADHESALTLAAAMGRAAVVAVDNRDALQGAGAVVLALRFAVLKGVIGEIADSLTDMVVIVPSNPLSVDADGHLSRLLPEGQSSTVSASSRAVDPNGFEPFKVGGIKQSGRLEVGGDLHDLVVGLGEVPSSIGGT